MHVQLGRAVAAEDDEVPGGAFDVLCILKRRGKEALAKKRAIWLGAFISFRPWAFRGFINRYGGEVNGMRWMLDNGT
jgi:hypothetical protein